MYATTAQEASATTDFSTEANHEHIVEALSRLREDNVDQIAIELMDENEGITLQSENQLSAFVEIIHEMVRHLFILTNENTPGFFNTARRKKRLKTHGPKFMQLTQGKNLREDFPSITNQEKNLLLPPLPRSGYNK